MTLRKHQREFDTLCDEIASGNYPIRPIVASVTPGGGKSMLPAILAQHLIGTVVDRICWVVPRSSLREQGEADFCRVSPYEIRATANGHELARDTHGYVTTYQAIVTDPDAHLREWEGKRWALFLDEPHHVASGGQWFHSLGSLHESATVVVYASGTFERGDGRPVAWIDDHPGADRYQIEYSRSDALADGAIAPIEFRTIDGEAEWEGEDGEAGRAVLSEAGDADNAAAVFTALRTDYARELLEHAISDWTATRETVPEARLLVVAPDIKTARSYTSMLSHRGFRAAIATSADTPAARRRIAEFKGEASPGVDVLVTVGMAYEGLSVPAITHVACLTHIRSVPWLEQCFARANRLYPGKEKGVIYGPKDSRFEAAISRIGAEQRSAPWNFTQAEPRESGDGGKGEGRPLVTPVSSRAHVEAQAAVEREFDYQGGAKAGPTPSQAESILRGLIHRHVRHVVDSRRPGSRGAMERVIQAKIRQVCDKPRAEMSRAELERVWMRLREDYPV